MSNFKIIETFLTNRVNYTKLKFEEENFVIDSGFIGSIIAVESIKKLYINVCEQGKIITYLPTYKLNEDHLLFNLYVVFIYFKVE